MSFRTTPFKLIQQFLTEINSVSNYAGEQPVWEKISLSRKKNQMQLQITAASLQFSPNTRRIYPLRN